MCVPAPRQGLRRPVREVSRKSKRIESWEGPWWIISQLPREPRRRFEPCHPHARGDISSSRVVLAASIGSPPRTWGHQRLEERIAAVWRFTPTHVGTSKSVCLDKTYGTVHHVRFRKLQPNMPMNRASGNTERRSTVASRSVVMARLRDWKSETSNSIATDEAL